MKKDEMVERGAALGRATEGIVAPSGLTDAVMAAVRLPEGGLFDAVRRFGLAAVVIASVAAAATLAVDMRTEASLAADTLATFSVVEPAD